MSLSANRSKAQSFSGIYARDGVSAPVFTIDTTQNPGAFRTAADIILNDGARLVGEKKVLPGTLFSAIKHLPNGENELFYVKGDIPGNYLM